MSNHNHDHSCICSHHNVKFCKHCNTVYCTDCNQEWLKRYYWTYTYPNTTITCCYPTSASAAQSSAQNVVSDNQLNDGHTVTVSTCNHKD